MTDTVLFNIESNNIHQQIQTVNMVLPGVLLISAILIIFLLFLFFNQQKQRLKIENDMLIQQNQLYHSQKSLHELEINSIQMENEALGIKLEAKRKEFIDIALNIAEQRSFLEKIASGIDDILKISDNELRNDKLHGLNLLLKQKMSFSDEKKEFYGQIEQIHKDFHLKLRSNFPNLTDLEKRLAGLLRLNLSNKEISALMNISIKSVEVARYRLKKKLNIDKDSNLIDFINNL
jgi:DNA-binding CsgD family transcriptional regulator